MIHHLCTCVIMFAFVLTAILILDVISKFRLLRLDLEKNQIDTWINSWTHWCLAATISYRAILVTEFALIKLFGSVTLTLHIFTLTVFSRFLLIRMMMLLVLQLIILFKS